MPSRTPAVTRSAVSLSAAHCATRRRAAISRPSIGVLVAAFRPSIPPDARIFGQRCNLAGDFSPILRQSADFSVREGEPIGLPLYVKH